MSFQETSSQYQRGISYQQRGSLSCRFYYTDETRELVMDGTMRVNWQVMRSLIAPSPKVGP